MLFLFRLEGVKVAGAGAGKGVKLACRVSLYQDPLINAIKYFTFFEKFSMNF